MKSMTKLMVVAMILAAALVVAPAAARDVTSGGTVFVGEKNVNLNLVFNNTTGADPTIATPGTLVHFDSITVSEGQRIGINPVFVEVSNPGSFEFTKTSFGSLTGQWYAFEKESNKNEDLTLLGTTSNPTYNGSIMVKDPSVSLDVKLAGTTDSVDGKKVTRNGEIEFEIEHNIGLSNDIVENSDRFFMTIEVTTPSGGTLTKLGNVDLSDVRLTGQKSATGTIKLEGLEAGTYTAQAKWGNTDALDSDKSNTVTFDIATKAVAISSSKDSVVRGNNFVVTITGESKADYWVFVKDAAIGVDEYPTILGDQPGVNTTVDSSRVTVAGKNLPTSYAKNVTSGAAAKWVVNDTIALVKTKADGTRGIEFQTTSDTKDRQFTIRVQDAGEPTKYDDVKVRVEKGGVTITASGTGVYYIGEEITFSGTCTDNETVYLFLTGPNLGTNGVNLKQIDETVTNYNGRTFAAEDVEADDTWSFKWNTAELARALDAGGYTIYAVSKPVGKDKLSDAEYATASIQLKSAYLTATSSGAIVAKGDDLKITGTAQGDPENVQVWIFGKNYYGKDNRLVDTASVESDGSFEYELKGAETKDLSPGQYFAVIQHPMTNDFGVVADAATGTIKGADTDSGIVTTKITNLQASAAATALINALDSPNVDDTYVKLTFNVEEAYIAIDPIGDKEAGSKFTISGTTNVAVGDKLIIDVTSSAFGPAKKTEAAGFGSVAGTVTVEKGDGANKWSFEVDAADLKPDQYIVKVECIETETTTTANFNLVEKVETTPTTEVTTTAPAGEVTTTAPAGETTTEPTPTPGFGALVALAGLGAVAFLVLRRK